MEIKLEHFGARGQCRNLLHRYGSEGGYAKHCAVFGCGAAHSALPIMMKQPLQGRGRAIERHCQFLPHHLNRHIHLIHPCQNIGDKINIIKGAGIAGIGDFIIRRAVNIVEYGPRQPLLRQGSKVLKIMAICQSHGRQA